MRAFRFTFLAISVGVIALLAWWLYWPDARLKAKEAIEEAGGLVLMNDSPGDSAVTVMLRPGVTEDELERLTPMDVLQPTSVRITPFSGVNDRGLVWLTRFPNLHTLLLEKADITD